MSTAELKGVSIVSLLPVRPEDDSYVTRYIDNLLRFVPLAKGFYANIREGKIERLKKILRNRSFTDLFSKDGFLLAYAAQQLKHAQLMETSPIHQFDMRFIDATQVIFERATGRKRVNNESTFLLFASFIRTKDNQEKRKKEKEETPAARPKRRYVPPARDPNQPSLYH